MPSAKKPSEISVHSDFSKPSLFMVVGSYDADSLTNTNKYEFIISKDANPESCDYEEVRTIAQAITDPIATTLDGLSKPDRATRENWGTSAHIVTEAEKDSFLTDHADKYYVYKSLTPSQRK